MTIERLHPSLAHHIVNTMGWQSLRPLQSAAVTPVLDGADTLLLAPTAGGKTEAAVFPVLSAMAGNGWNGVSVLYVCPLKALLNNLLPRLELYATWVGRRVGLWHGDVSASRRGEILRDPPDILLTTPESIESMLVSTKVDHRCLFAGLRAVIVDEVHAFAGDDRGWHLLAVLERLTHLIDRPIQRIGLSATVGNPSELLSWLQGSSEGVRTARVVAPAVTTVVEPDIQLDYVGSVSNAARVVAALHQGEKRLVFADSKRLVEQLGAELRTRGVTTFLSHASLSADERKRSERAFAEARDCVIVATSTLELGIDVGDLDRVIQLNAPGSVASFLQRLGRTGRRPGSNRNCLFLALDEDSLLNAAGLLLLWSRGFVEPIKAPPEPRHIMAQQMLALCLQEHRVGSKLWSEWWNGLFGDAARPIVDYLVEEGFLDQDGGMLFIGTLAEKRFGRRNFMDLTAVFTAAPEFTVLSGREELGRTDPGLLTEKIEGPRLILLGGRTWKVTWIDWRHRRCFVEPFDGLGGKARWISSGLGGASFALSRSMRDVLLGADPPVRITHRAATALAAIRENSLDTVHPGGTVIVRDGDDLRWWTWAGYRANRTLQSTLGSFADQKQQVGDAYLRLRPDVSHENWKALMRGAQDTLCRPDPDRKALEGLKFNAALPVRLAEQTMAARLADLQGAATVLNEAGRFTDRTA
ncbi:DEAD/DEAH box helicase [Planomonospora parontospora]|uniref:DEAD/DEAH box helicase n=1 Tax=Planomonospora parontospora TaxID=58119 RepID=UPI0019C56518|nr:DEAD/DEAH box helicase [Planomonospora parontospora]GGL33552.1 ATP-dependent helicase [Planomonospora parontospora subsp. antibiotica]GII17164.1 ATP-dependent helicase [Planomonospora parontospora subsp. antibiotica]